MKTKKEIEETLKHCQDIRRDTLEWVLEPPTGYVAVAPDDVRVGDFVSCNGTLTEIKRIDWSVVEYRTGVWVALSSLQDLGATFLRPTPEPEYVQLPEGTEPAEGMFVRFADGTYHELVKEDGVVWVPSYNHSTLFDEAIKALGLPLYRLTVPKPVAKEPAPKTVQFLGVVAGHFDAPALVNLPVDDFPPGTRVRVTKVEGGA